MIAQAARAHGPAWTLVRLKPLRYVRTDALKIAHFGAVPSDVDVALLLLSLKQTEIETARAAAANRQNKETK